MTEKEKAKELIERFMTELFYIPDVRHKRYPTAIQCALICVEEMLELAKGFDKALSPAWKSVMPEEKWSQVIYWQKVKEEISKL
jgi:competence CoiA-like predicted nuclease